MKVVISAGGRFHAQQLAYQLQMRNSLQKLFTFDYTKRDELNVSPALVQSIASCKIMNDLFVRFQLARFCDKTRFNIFKDNLFDHQVSKKIDQQGSIDLFVGWAHYALQSMPAARRAGAKIIIESGSCHILTQQALLIEEYKRWGLSYPPIHERTIKKMLEEYQQTDYIMTLSSYARNSFIAQGIAPEKVLMVPCGVDVDFFLQQAPINFATTRKKFRVIFVGLVTLRKGIQYLIQAWAKAKLPEADTELVIVGAMQRDFVQIRAQLPIKNNVVFVGPTDRDTLRKHYQQSSLFVLPSIEDGFGMVVGEAMASGLPVICSTSTAGPELIRDGEHGFLVQPADADQLAEKIEWCYQNRGSAESMGQAGQQQIQKFTWDAYGQKVYEQYKRIK